jgi:Carboxypeptidase regulatory-like domain
MNVSRFLVVWRFDCNPDVQRIKPLDPATSQKRPFVLAIHPFSGFTRLPATTTPSQSIEEGNYMKTLLHYLTGVLAMMFLSGAVALAQVESGAISGTVTDQSGATITGATVTATNLNTNASRTSTTAGSGSYSISGLEPATYQISVESGSFKPFTGKVEVTTGGHVTLDAKLSVSGATTEVEVVAEGGAQVNTQTQDLSQVINRQQVEQLPSLTRNPYDFVALSGNISAGDSSNSGDERMNGNSQNATLRGVGFNINGQRSSGTEILLDGVENISLFGDGIGIVIPVDAMQEFRITTNNFQPQFGRAAGGIVSVTTRAGGNAFHGDAWEFNRLSAYTANTVTNSQEGLPKGLYTRNQFGFAVGGPVIKDKLFFFATTEWTRVRSSASLVGGVPTADFLALSAPNIQSYFSQYAGGKTFNYSSTYTAADVGITGIPASTVVFGTVPYTAPENAGGGVPQNTYNVTGRVDYNFSEKTQAYFRYVDYKELDESGSNFASPYPQYNVGETEENSAYLLNLSHVFSPSLLTNTKLSFSRLNTFNSFNTALQNVPTLFVSANAQIPGTGTFINLPGFYDTNPANGGLPFGGPQDGVQINQDLNWLKGKHSFQFGTQIMYIQDNNAYGAYAQAGEQLGINRSAGLQSFLTGNLYEFEAAVNPAGALPCVRDPYTLALTQTAGCSVNLPAGSPSFARSNRYHDWAVYGQDSFRVTPKFTFNYGVRYEYYGVQHNNNKNLDSNYYYGTGSTFQTQIRNGQVFTTPNSPIKELWQPQYGTVSPRIGFAYDLFGNGRTSIRGGYGISYERNFGNVTFNVIQNPPNYAVIVINNTPVTNSNAGPLAGSSGAVPLPPTSLRNVAQNIRTSQTQFWSAALEHQLTPTTVVSFQYAAARGIHLYDIKNINGLGSGNVFEGDPTQDAAGNQGLTRLNPQYSNINNRGSGGDSYYQAGNIQFQTTNLHRTGLSLVANYTFAHQLDDLSTTFSETNNAFNLGYTDPFNPAMDRGNGDLDIRHRLVMGPIYDTPWYGKGSMFKQALFGWQTVGIYQTHTGATFTYFDSTNDVSGYNIPRYAPASGGVPQRTFKSLPSGADGGGSNLYTVGNLPAAASFSDPNYLLGASDWGPYPANMTSRNAFRGPGQWTFDAAVSKVIPIHEQINMEFRAEGFNILNHHNLYLQESFNDVADTGDGVPIPIFGSKGGIGNNGGSNDERRFGQFSLKVNF